MCDPINGRPLTLLQLITPGSRHRGISLSSPLVESPMKSSCSAETKDIIKVINKTISFLFKYIISYEDTVIILEKNITIKTYIKHLKKALNNRNSNLLDFFFHLIQKKKINPYILFCTNLLSVTYLLHPNHILLFHECFLLNLGLISTNFVHQEKMRYIRQK